ncbi:MAG TPA: SurA N-terminal domain-containing protein, partial [Micropepsaceae bacterium]|nr:SurA N-terminal domain-containing protein [Micropepsaceae bacterium]
RKMLQSLRKATKSWVASVLAGVLVLAFALWGVQDVFRGSADTVVADVGKGQISSSDYDRAMKNQIRAFSAQTQTEITMDQAKAIGLDRNVLDTAISQKALDEEGRSLGLTASQNTVNNQITSDKNFVGAGGAFDQNVFLRALQDNGFSPQGFMDITAENITRGQLIGATVDGVAAPPGLVRLLFDYTSEQRTMEYIVITPEEAGKVPEPSMADLEAYHKAHAAEFSAPEYRSFDYVQIGPDQVASDIQISEDEIKTQYDKAKATYVKPEERDVQQIAFPDKAAADAAAARIKTGADFLAVAREKNLKDEDINLGTKTEAQLDPKLAEAVFAVPQGGATAPVQGPFGWVILRAAKVTPAENKTLDDVKGQIKADLVKIRSIDKLKELSDKLEDARGGGAGLTDAAMKLGLTVHHIAAADRKGMTPEDTKADIPPQAQVLDTVFMTESGEESDTFQTMDGQYFAIKVTAITPPALKPLDSVREQVREGYLKDARAKQLQEKVKMLADQAMKDMNLAGVGKSLGHAPVTSKPMRRNETDDVFSNTLMAQLFAAQQGGIVTGAAGKGDGVVIARVTAVNHPEPDVSSAEYANFRQVVGQQLGESALDTLAAATRKQVGVNIHQATVQQVLGGTQQ